MTQRDEYRAQGIRRLAGGVAHDLGNLLLVISGLSELALKRLSGDAAPRNEIERIQRAASRASELARDLLAVACKQALRPREIDLNQSLVDSQPRLRGITGEAIDLQFVLGADLPSVFVDPEQLERVLVKLAECVRHRMPRGGRCVLETGATEARESIDGSDAPARARRFATLTARDTGADLAPAAEARIFEPYYSPTEGAGLGLALAVVEGIVAQSGGRIRLHSGREHGGASFEVLLPAAGSHPPGEIEPR